MPSHTLRAPFLPPSPRDQWPRTGHAAPRAPPPTPPYLPSSLPPQPPLPRRCHHPRPRPLLRPPPPSKTRDGAAGKRATTERRCGHARLRPGAGRAEPVRAVGAGCRGGGIWGGRGGEGDRRRRGRTRQRRSAGVADGEGGGVGGRDEPDEAWHLRRRGEAAASAAGGGRLDIGSSPPYGTADRFTVRIRKIDCQPAASHPKGLGSGLVISPCSRVLV